MKLGLGSLGISSANVKSMIYINCQAQPSRIFKKKVLQKGCSNCLTTRKIRQFGLAMDLLQYRSSHRRCSIKKVFLKVWQIHKKISVPETPFK